MVSKTVYAFGIGDITDQLDAYSFKNPLKIVGSNRNKDFGLRVHVPAGEVVDINCDVLIRNCFVNLIKSGDGLLRIRGKLVTRAFGGDNANIRGSRVEIGFIDAQDNTPTRPYAMCVRKADESVAECLSRCEEVVFDAALLAFEPYEVDGVVCDVIKGYHVDGVVQMMAFKPGTFEPDPRGEICHVIIPKVFARINGKQSQGVMGSEFVDYHEIEIGTDLFDVELDGYEFHTVFNTLRNSKIGCAGANLQGKLKISNVKGACVASKNVCVMGIAREDVVGDVEAVVFVDHVGVVMSSNVIEMSTAGLKQLIESEAAIPHLYYCEAGVPTIGVGHALSRSELNSGKIHLRDGSVIDFRNGRELSHDEQMRLLRSDLPAREKVIRDAVGDIPITQDNFDALVHFVFNVGRTAFLKSTLLKKLRKLRFQDVPEQIKRWKYTTIDGVKTESPGLISRRLTEVEMWNGLSERWSVLRGSAKSVSRSSDISLVGAAHSLGIGSRGYSAGGVSDAGFDQTLEQARKQAESEFQSKITSAGVDAVDSFKRSNVQKPMQSRTNKTIAGMVVATGLRVVVATTGLSAIFSSPEVAEMVTSLAVGGLEILTVGLGAVAIKFRNAATKFIG